MLSKLSNEMTTLASRRHLEKALAVQLHMCSIARLGTRRTVLLKREKAISIGVGVTVLEPAKPT